MRIISSHLTGAEFGKNLSDHKKSLWLLFIKVMFHVLNV